jgi:hypothetical protein
MTPKTKSLRRAHEQRAKARTRRIMKLWHGQAVGRADFGGADGPARGWRERLDRLSAVRLLDMCAHMRTNVHPAQSFDEVRRCVSIRMRHEAQKFKELFPSKVAG